LSSHPPINRRIMLLYQMAALPGSAERLRVEALHASGAL